MKAMKRMQKWFVGMTVAGCLCAAATVRASDVYALTFSGTGRIQDSQSSHKNCNDPADPSTCDFVDVIATHAVNNQALVDLALGNNPSVKPSANTVLAIVSDCGNGSVSIVVFDKANQTVLQDVADFGNGDFVDAQKEICVGSGVNQTCDQVETASEGLIELPINISGHSGTNSIDGGDLFFYIKAKLDTNGCPTKITAAGMGSLDVTTTDNLGDTTSSHVLVPNAKLTTGAKIATLP